MDILARCGRYIPGQEELETPIFEGGQMAAGAGVHAGLSGRGFWEQRVITPRRCLEGNALGSHQLVFFLK